MDRLKLLAGAALGWLLRILPKRPLSYWVLAFSILGLSIWISPFIDDTFNLVRARYWLFQNLTQSATNPAQFRDIKIVLIGDDEYWKWGGELAHRIPTNRTYLSRIVDALDRAGVSVIALDFDMRLPDPKAPGTAGDTGEIEPAYRAETEALIASIAKAARNRPVVLARTILQHAGGAYYVVADIYQPYGICNALIADGRWLSKGTPKFPLDDVARAHLSCGYIGLPRDMRQIPPPLDVGEKGRLDSFAYAMVRAKDPYVAPDLSSRNYYATYIPQDVVASSHVIVSAHDLLSSDPAVAYRAADSLRGNLAIVGAGWHKSAKGVGELNDTHMTPIAETNGALIHANFAEAIMSGRHYPAVSSEALHWLEFAFGVVAVIGFAISQNIWIRVASLVGAAIALFAIQWLTLQVLGTFFDAFIPVFGVGLHAIVERLISRD